ncbi:MAG: hypothetical protein QOH33_987 [Paraburkholderia sp.]|nr:hypothetical protein [Paraburkholderia sp.]
MPCAKRSKSAALPSTGRRLGSGKRLLGVGRRAAGRRVRKQRGKKRERAGRKKTGAIAPEQQRQEENGDAAADASHVPLVETAPLGASSKFFRFCLPIISAGLLNRRLARLPRWSLAHRWHGWHGQPGRGRRRVFTGLKPCCAQCLPTRAAQPTTIPRVQPDAAPRFR